MSKLPKKLYRSKSTYVVGGVCGGLGEYFGIDPVLFRALFLLLALADGAGIIGYGILWFIVPKSQIIENNS